MCGKLEAHAHRLTASDGLSPCLQRKGFHARAERVGCLGGGADGGRRLAGMRTEEPCRRIARQALARRTTRDGGASRCGLCAALGCLLGERLALGGVESVVPLDLVLSARGRCALRQRFATPHNGPAMRGSHWKFPTSRRTMSPTSRGKHSSTCATSRRSRCSWGLPAVRMAPLHCET